MIPENHAREQYFFAPETLDALVALARPYDAVCCLCCPTLGAALAEAGRPAAAVLDLDERFRAVPGFRRWDLARPEHLPQRFGLIVCDPPFFSVGLRQLAAAIRLLADHDPGQPLLVSYLVRRERQLLSALRTFDLHRTALVPRYPTVSDAERNRIAFWGSNLAGGH